jgi:cell division protein FtsQ
MKPGRLLLALLAIAGALVLSRVAFRVESIAITGNERVSDAEILAATGLSVGDPLLWIGSGDLARALALPWIAQIDATRSLSGELRITIREREPAATVIGEAGRYVVAAGGATLPGAAEPSLTIRGWGRDRIAESISAAAYLEGFAEVRAIEYDPAAIRLSTSRGTIRTPDLAALRHAGPAALRLQARERSIASWGVAASGLAPLGSAP